MYAGALGCLPASTGCAPIPAVCVPPADRGSVRQKGGGAEGASAVTSGRRQRRQRTAHGAVGAGLPFLEGDMTSMMGWHAPMFAAALHLHDSCQTLYWI